jgi:hypothetical protein
MTGAVPRARRIPVTADPRDLDGPVDYVDGATVEVPVGDGRSPEQWFRSVFEGAPAALRAVMNVGWRFGLLLRLAPRTSPAHILGWRIVSSAPEVARVEAESVLLHSRLVLRLSDGAVVMTSNIRFRRASGRAVWLLAGPVHRRIVPYLLGRAARR